MLSNEAKLAKKNYAVEYSMMSVDMIKGVAEHEVCGVEPGMGVVVLRHGLCCVLRLHIVSETAYSVTRHSQPNFKTTRLCIPLSSNSSGKY